MKRFFLFVAALCCMGMMSVNALAEKVYDESSKLYFELDDATSTAIVVQDKSGSDNYNYLSGKVTIPAEITYSAKDYTVTTIGKYAFRNNTTITEYVLPEDGALTTIESAAFDQSAVEKINIPSTVTEIPYSSFYKSALYNNDANYEDGILYIDGCLISAKTSLAGEVTLKEGTRLIAGSAFNACKTITHVTIPEGVTYIGCNAFNNCSALEQVNFPASLNFIGDNAFLNCKLREVYLKSPLTIGKMAFFATTPSIQTVVLPKGESTFNDYAFSGQPGITRINVYEKDPSLLHMGTGVFDDVDKEKCIVYVPHELNGGSVSDFKATDEWSTFIIQSNNVCADGLFFELNDVTKKMTLTYELYDSYFNYCTLEENVDMVSNIHAIHAFDELGYTLTSVGARAFEQASQITSITLPETVEQIGKMAFSDLNQMKEFTIPEKVNFIGEFAFSDCTGLEKLTNLNPVPQDIKGKAVFYGVDVSGIKLMVPQSSRTAYLLADTWGSFDIRVLPIRVGDLYYYFNDEDDYAEVTYQYELSEDNYAFLPSYTELVIPEEVTYNEKTYPVWYITSGAFQNCNQIKEVEIPGSVIIVGSSAFQNCKNLMWIKIHEGVRNLERHVFEGCEALRNVYLPSTLDNIENYAFKGCTDLTVLSVYNPEPIVLPANVFDDTDKTGIRLYIPYGSKAAYLAADIWKEIGRGLDYHNIIEMSNGVQVDEFYYIFDKVNKTATCTFEYLCADGYPQFNYYYPGVIPSTVTYEEEEYTVTAIGDYAFWDASNINSLEIPATVTSIGNYAFANNNKPVTLIVNNETPIDIAGKHVFENSPLDILFVPAGSAQAYEEAEGWKDFDAIIEKGIKVGDLYYNFNKDGKIASVTWEKYNNDNNYKALPEEVNIPEKVIYDEVEYTITEIEWEAFASCKSMKKVIIPATVTEIGRNAFHDCSNLSSVICLSVTPPELGIYVFNLLDCSKITLGVRKESIEAYEDAEQWKEFDIKEAPICGEHLFWEVKDDKLIITGYGDMWNWDEEGGIYAPWHDDRKNITSIQLPEGLTSIGDCAFYYCISLESITIPASVTSIGKGAFYYCRLVESLTIPDGVTSIGEYAFYACNALESVTIPAGVTTIGVEAFSNCVALKNINVSAENEHYCDIDGVLFNKLKTILLQYPEGKTEESYTVPDGVTEIGVAAFTYCGIESIHLPDGLTTIGDGAFNSSGLSTIDLPSTLTFIGPGAFNRIPLMTIDIPEGVTSIEEATFAECTMLQSIHLPASLTSIGHFAFYSCASLESIDIPAGVTSIDENAFQFCNGLKSVTCRAPEPPVLGDDVFFMVDCSKIPLYVPLAALDKYKNADQWKTFNPIESYDATVTFLDKDGNLIEEQYVVKGEGAVAPEAPEVEGYHFTGWDPADLSKVTEDLTVKATYAINTYTVKFYDHSDNVISTQTVNWNEAALEPELAAWEGHTFTSWSADFEHVKSDLDIKPIYDVEVYKVTFLGFNDTELKVENVEYGKNATAPDAPDVEGYTFTGWDKEFDNVTSDLTVKAKYEINHYALTLVAGHGTIAITDESGEHSLNPDMVMHGTIVKLIVTADDGYLFKGWSDSNTDNPRYVTVTEDKTFTALFEKEPDDPTGVEEVESQKSKVESTKLLRDGMLYILREGKMYNAQGQKVQ